MKDKVTLFLVILGFNWIIYNLFKINILNHDVFKTKLDYYTTYQIYTVPQRGSILDRNLKPIAYQKENVNLVLNRYRYETLDVNQRNYVKKFIDKLGIVNLTTKNYSSRIILKDNPTYEEICFVLENLLYLYGVEVDIGYKRVYDGPPFAFVTGFVNIPYKEDIEKDPDLYYYTEVGKSGLELQYNELLKGKLGKVKYLIDPSGHPVKTIEDYPSSKGNDLVTTIIKKLQIFSYNELKSLCDQLSYKNKQPVGGSIIVMKVDGQILSLVSYPSFDPNNLKPDCNDVIREFNEFSCFYDRAIAGEYPAASTFKIITSLAALEEKIINKNTHIYCSGAFFVGNHPFYCFNTYGHGNLDIVNALAVSCDVFYYTLGYRLGIDKIKKYCEILGLNQKTGIDLPFENEGLIPDKLWKEKFLSEEWTKGDDVNISIGQGFGLVTPLQMAVAVAGVATGYRPVPYINLSKKPVLYKLPFKQENLILVRKGMQEAINIGTATIIKQMVKKYKVAGKTGTAEIVPNSNNPKGLNNTWFVGYFGSQNPEYVIVVSLEASGGYGGQYASFLAGKIINFMETKIKIPI